MPLRCISQVPIGAWWLRAFQNEKICPTRQTDQRERETHREIQRVTERETHTDTETDRGRETEGHTYRKQHRYRQT